MGTSLVLRLTGDRARLGQADAVDLARLILGTDSVIRRTASALVGRRSGVGGKLPAQIAEAVRLQLRGVFEGSLVVELEIAGAEDLGDALPLDDAGIGETTVLTALAVLEGSETGFRDTAKAWNKLAGDLDIGGRNDSLTLDLPSHARPVVVLDESVRARIADASQPLPQRGETGERVGVLVEADFEKNSARLRSADGAAVAVSFDDQHTAPIKEALLEQTRLRGDITFSEHTSDVVAVDLVEVLQTDQLVLGLPVMDFWATKSVTELAAEQGVSPVDDIDELRIDAIEQNEIDAFMEAMGL